MSPQKSGQKLEARPEVPIVPKIVLAEEELIEAFEAEAEDRRKWEIEDEQKQLEESMNTNIEQSYGKADMARAAAQLNKEKMDEEANLEMERMYMEREAKQSQIANQKWHRERFMQKDMKPPVLPFCLTDDAQPLKNIFVQPNLPSTTSQADSILRMKVKITLPRKIGKIKILWS